MQVAKMPKKLRWLLSQTAQPQLEQTITRKFLTSWSILWTPSEWALMLSGSLPCSSTNICIMILS